MHLEISPLKAPPARSFLFRRQFWLANIALWSFFGLMMASQLYFSMRDHGHHGWRILLWQLIGAVTWMALSPLIFILKQRFPLDGPQRRRSLVLHGLFAVISSLGRLVLMTVVSMELDPYRPVRTETTFPAEYAVQVLQWLPMDLLIYSAVLLVAHAYDYREQVHRDQLRAAWLKAELVDAELRALRLELQPHFLFNTLNALVGLVRNQDHDLAERMLLGLSELLRSTLDGRRRQLVPLAEEIEITDLYLDIQRTRFGERIGFRWTIQEDAKAAWVPSLLLQPLVENAIRHAVELGSGQGKIEVRASREGDRLQIAVEDDGPHSALEAPRRKGLGLDNVRSRLEALFGEAWSLELESLPERGTCVDLSFPWRETAPHEKEM